MMPGTWTRLRLNVPLSSIPSDRPSGYGLFPSNGHLRESPTPSCLFSHRVAPLASRAIALGECTSVTSRNPWPSTMSRDEMPWPPRNISSESPSLNQSCDATSIRTSCHIISDVVASRAKLVYSESSSRDNRGQRPDNYLSMPLYMHRYAIQLYNVEL